MDCCMLGHPPQASMFDDTSLMLACCQVGNTFESRYDVFFFTSAQMDDGGHRVEGRLHSERYLHAYSDLALVQR